MFFSVIIPLYNKADFIAATIDSVLAQDYGNFEIVVVDDGSTDGSSNEIFRLGDARISLLHQKNAGPGPARNKAAEVAQGEWLAFIDADDVWAPDHLSELTKTIDGFPAADIVSTTSRQINNATLSSMSESAGPGDCRGVDYLADGGEEFVQTSSIAVRRSSFVGEGGFKAICPGEDSEFWARLSLNHSYAINRAKTSGYRRGTQGIMEQMELLAAPPTGPGLSPVQVMLNISLADQHCRNRHIAIHAYLDRIHVRDARICLVRGYPGVARAHLRASSLPKGLSYAAYFALTHVPGSIFKPAFRFASQTRNQVRSAFWTAAN